MGYSRPEAVGQARVPKRVRTDYTAGNNRLSMIRFGFSMVLFGMCAVAEAQSWPPSSGQSVDEARTFRQLTKQPEPCLSIKTGEATTLVPLSKVQQVAQASPQSLPDKDEPRSAVVARLRAQRVLQNLADTKDAFGCMLLNQIPDEDAEGMAASFMEAGQAYVVPNGSFAGVPEVKIRYVADHIMGNILYYQPEDRRPFFLRPWWVR